MEVKQSVLFNKTFAINNTVSLEMKLKIQD